MDLKELARRIVEMTGSDSEIVFRPLPEDDPKVRQPDISRARKVLNWSPQVEMDEGLKATIADFRRRLGP
jgi:dTDP-glucose 4,6-dehydratase